MNQLPPNAASNASENFESVLRERLAPLAASHIELVDDSALHAGHEGAKSGGGHYRLLVVSAAFTGKSTVHRHRLVYEALGEMMRHQIHALSIKSLTPEEV